MEEDLISEILRRTAERAVEKGVVDDARESVAICVTTTIQVMLERNMFQPDDVLMVKDLIETYGRTH